MFVKLYEILLLHILQYTIQFLSTDLNNPGIFKGFPLSSLIIFPVIFPPPLILPLHECHNRIVLLELK